MAYEMLVSNGQNLLGEIKRFAHHGNINPVNYTWEVWFRPDSFTDEFVIMGLPSDSNSVRLGCVPSESGNGVNFYVELAENRHIHRDLTLLNTGQWYYVALVHEDLGGSNGKFRLYVFGREYQLFGTVNHSMPMNLYLDFGGVLTQGMLGQTITSVIQGAIDEVRIWREAISKEQIDDRMSSRMSATEAKALSNRLLAYISFDSLTQDGEFKDLTGNGNDLYRETTATVSATTNIDRTDTFDTNVIAGGPKRALSFPGQANCYISIPASLSLYDFTELTVEAWIKPDANLPPGTYTIIHQEDSFWLGIDVIEYRGGTDASLAYIINTPDILQETKQQITYNMEVRLGEWQHVAIAGNVFDSNKDGVPDQVYRTCAVNGQQPSPRQRPRVEDETEVLQPDAHDLTIGASQNDRKGKFKPFQGSISEVRIWRQDLTVLGTNPDGSGSNVLELESYRWQELPYQPHVDPSAVGAQQVMQQLSCQSPELMAYYKFNHGKPGKDNTKPQRVNWLGDSSRKRNHGRLSDGFALTGKTSNWVEADIKDASGNIFKVLSSYGNPDVVPESGLLLEAPKLYRAETHPKQAIQHTNKSFSSNEWEEIAGLYLLVNAKPNDVLVITLNGRRLHNTTNNAGVALGIAVEGDVENRSGIYYEYNYAPPKEEVGGMSMQYVYIVPSDIQGLLAVRGMFAAYGGGKAVIEQGGKSTLDVMSYSQRQDTTILKW